MLVKNDAQAPVGKIDRIRGLAIAILREYKLDNSLPLDRLHCVANPISDPGRISFGIPHGFCRPCLQVTNCPSGVLVNVLLIA